MGSRGQKYLEEAYNLVIEQEEVALAKLKDFVPGKIYKDISEKDSPTNQFKFITGYGKETGLQRIYQQDYLRVTDNMGILSTSPKNILNMVPSDMSTEEYDEKHNAFWRSRQKEIDSYKYSH